MTFELQHSDIPQRKLLDADPVTTDWPMPPVKRWEPRSGFDLDAMCEDARAALSAKLIEQAERHKDAIAADFDTAHDRLGVVPVSWSYKWHKPGMWMDRGQFA